MPPRPRSIRVRQISDKAHELVREGDAVEWNNWRRQYDLFGDKIDARINLSGAKLSKIDLRDFVLTNVDFSHASLISSLFDGCDCTSVNFYLASLHGSDFSAACLKGANLSRAYLRNAKLDYADLRGSDLRRASLTGASLVAADLRGVDLSGVRGLSQSQIEVARGDERTRLPPHLSRPGTWLRGPSPAPRAPPPGSVPEAVPATVEVLIEMGRLSLAADAGDALFTSSFDAEDVRQNIIDDLIEILPRLSNTGALYTACSRYLSSLKNASSDIIVLGMRGVHLSAHISALSNSGEGSPELLTDIIGSLNGIIIQHFLYVNQSHRWRSFFEEATRSNFGPKDLSSSEQHGRGLAEILRLHEVASAPDVANALDLAAAEARERGSDAKLLVFNIYGGIQNILRTLAGWCVREFRKAGSLTWETFRDTVAKRVGQAAATLVISVSGWFIMSGLAAAWPEYFGWFQFFSNLLK